MSTIAVTETRREIPPLFGWRRVRSVILLSTVLGLLVGGGWTSGLPSLLFRAVTIGLVAMLVFGVFERWPKRLPRRVARWVLQVAAVGISIPITTFWIWVFTTPHGAPPFYEVEARRSGFLLLTSSGMLFAPWAALAALIRQKEAFAREQALTFELERTKLERQALDARLHLLQGQVAPHFLFNTLANVQALVDEGSPQAPAVLRSLVAYLRAAVPRIHDPITTLGQEIELVRAYLELMHMRMPDRLQFTVHADEAALALRCPPMTLLTLVENAVRHGIDPSEEGGRIDLVVQRRDGRCVVRVSDTGAGLREGNAGLGTGLATLRERLELTFGGDASLRIAAQQPRGVSVELEFPAQEGKAA
jgi:signal transduction histidine kinase